MEQSKVEHLLRLKAKARVPTLEKAVVNLEKKLARKKEYVERAVERAERKVAAWEKLLAQYQEDIKTASEGSYRGYNGKPFGATPTLSEGLV